MPRFHEAVAKGAAVLNLPTEVFLATLTQIGISEDDWSHLTQEDFVNELKKAKATEGLPGFKVRKAHLVISQTLQGTAVGLPAGVTAASATVEQLVQVIDILDPESDVLQELLRRPIGGRAPTLKLGGVAFLVLNEADELDRKGTMAVIDLLRRGMPPSKDEIMDPQSGKPYVVYHVDELPSSQTLIDPLFPEEDLHLGLSKRFSVFIRLAEEKHRLLLFLRRKGKVQEPGDKPACENELVAFANLGVDDLLDRYGGRGVYVKAKRLPVGAPAGLPSIVRSAVPARSGNPGHAVTMSSSPSAAPTTPTPAPAALPPPPAAPAPAPAPLSLPSSSAAPDREPLSDWVSIVTELMTVPELRDHLSSRALPAAGAKMELMARFMDAFRARRVSVEAVLANSSADFLKEVCLDFGLPLLRKAENVEAILRALSRRYEQDGALYRRDEAWPAHNV